MTAKPSPRISHRINQNHMSRNSIYTKEGGLNPRNFKSLQTLEFLEHEGIKNLDIENSTDFFEPEQSEITPST